MTPRTLALVAAALAAAGCSPGGAGSCPGAPIGTFSLQGTLRTAQCGDPPVASAAFAAAMPPAFGPRDVTFSAAGASGLAVCTASPLAATLYGTRSGDHVTAQTSSEGAVLAGCAPTCSAVVTYALAGDLVAGPDGVASGFAGTYSETFAPAPASACGGCALPCTAVYDVPGPP